MPSWSPVLRLECRSLTASRCRAGCLEVDMWTPCRRGVRDAGKLVVRSNDERDVAPATPISAMGAEVAVDDTE